MSGSIEPHFSEASNDIPGHPRLMTAMDVTQQIGTTNMNIHVAMDYQAVAGMHVPRHVSINIGGAYAFPMEFVGCSVSKEITVAPPPK